MLRNIFVVLGMVFCFCVSCDKEDNDVKAVENMRDWYKVEDKPGEVNHLLYKMYKYYDVTIFIVMWPKIVGNIFPIKAYL